MLYPVAQQTLKYALEHGTIPFLKGPPGVGKTDMITAVAAELGRPVVTETLATMEAIDLRGLPNTDHATRTVWWAKPDFIEKLEQASAHGTKAPILFIDEANAVGQALQVPMMQLTLRGVIGPHTLPDGTSIVLAGNRRADRAAAQSSPTALNNRVQHLPVEVCVKTWLKWAANAQLHPAICAFIMLRGEGQKGANGQPDKPGMLHHFDPTKPDEEAFRSPRTWAMCHPWVDAPDEIREGGIRGIVGEHGSTEFKGFLDVFRNLPPLASIIANPDTAKVPTNSSIAYAVTIALSRAANGGNLANILKYLARLGKEFEVMGLTDAVRRHEAAELHNTTAYIHWQAANSDITV